MTKVFVLFVARDGDAIVRASACQNLESAERWAMRVIKEYFKLDTELWSDFSDVLSDTDGCILMDFEALANLCPQLSN